MTARKVGFAALALVNLLSIAVPVFAVAAAATDTATISDTSAYPADSLGHATCSVNGKPVPCDVVAEQLGGFLGAGLLVLLIMLAILIACGVFWLLMLIHAATHPILNRPLWILVIVFGNVVGAAVYYFAVKRPYDRMAGLSPRVSPGAASAGSKIPSPLTPPVSPQIADFIHTSRQQGITDEDIRQALIRGGWQANDVDRALHP